MLFDSLIKPALDSVTALIGQFHLSPEDKVKAEQAIAAAQVQAKQASDDYEVKLNDIAGQNIRTDAASQDKFTSRARPTFMYIVESILAVNYIVIPTIQLVSGKDLAPYVLPGDLLTLFGICITGYVMSRTAENVAALPGDSHVSVLGMTVKNNSGVTK